MHHVGDGPRHLREGCRAACAWISTGARTVTHQTLTIVPASGKHTTKKNSMVIRKKGASRFIGQNDVAKAAQADYARQARAQWQGPPLTGAVWMVASFYVSGEASARPDVSNLVSMLHDALEGICYLDDAQVTHCDSYKVRSATGKVQIEVSIGEDP